MTIGIFSTNVVYITIQGVSLVHTTAHCLYVSGCLGQVVTIAGKIRILLVDDHPTVRRTLRSALQAYPNIEVVGEASDGEEALSSMASLRPAVVVMDINMSRMDGITATRLIKVQYPEVAVIGLSLEKKDYQLYAMKKAGALEVIPKESSIPEVYGAIQRAVATVQPVLVMEETSLMQQALQESEPSPAKELINTGEPMEGPQTEEGPNQTGKIADP